MDTVRQKLRKTLNMLSKVTTKGTGTSEDRKSEPQPEPLVHTKERKYTFLAYQDGNESGKLPSVLVNGLHLNFVAAGSFGRVESLKGAKCVKKNHVNVLPRDLDGTIFGVRNLDSVSTAGCKEVLILRRINGEDASEKYAPLLLGATFDTYANVTHALTLVRDVTMTHTGRSIAHWLNRNETLPVKLLLQQGLEALKFLHNIGVYHCDVSSGNVTYDRLTNRFRLIDFGQSSFSFSMLNQGYQPLKLLDTDARQLAACVVYPEAFMTPSCQEDKTIVHLLDPIPVDGFLFLGEEEITTFPFRDISLVLANCYQRRSFNHRYDIYSLGMVVANTMGFDIPDVREFCYADAMHVRDKKARKALKSNAVTLCRHNRRLRGGLAYHELEFWKEFINDELCIVDSLTDDEDKICELDWAGRIFGSDVSETLKSMIHPLPRFRIFGGYSLQNSNRQLDDEEFHFHVSNATIYPNLNDREHSTIVVNILWAVPFDEQNVCDDKGEAANRGRKTYCRVGSVSFRRNLDLPPDRAYVQRIYVQPNYRGMIKWLLRRALQKTYTLFMPPLARDKPVDLIILVANSMEQNLIATSFAQRAVQMDKNHMKIVGWHIYDKNEPPPVGHGKL
jgi:serine/threonine protein kinase